MHLSPTTLTTNPRPNSAWRTIVFRETPRCGRRVGLALGIQVRHDGPSL